MTATSSGRSPRGSRRTAASSYSKESVGPRSTRAATTGSPRSSGSTRPDPRAGSRRCSTRRPSEPVPQKDVPITVTGASAMGGRRAMRVAAILVLGTLLLGALVVLPVPGAAENPPLILTIADPADLRSANILRAPFGPYYEDGTAEILAPVYSSLLISDPVTSVLRPYIVKGVDADANGVFDAAEYGVFDKVPGTNATDVTAYLDLNGVRWHDGVQMDAMDVM